MPRPRFVAVQDPGVTFVIVRPVAAPAAVAARTRTCGRTTVAPDNNQELDVTLLDELSAGSSARTWRAEVRDADGAGRILAVRILRDKGPDLEETLHRMREENRRLARLSHRHIVRVEEVFAFEGYPAILAEYVEGMDLSQVVDALRGTRRRFPARAALEAGVATADALDAASRQLSAGQREPTGGVDLTPSSLVLGADGVLKVQDFGLTPTSSSRGSATGMVRLGSWTYMAPERKAGSQGDHASDVYSLGLVLIELLSPEPLPGLPVSVSEHDAVLRAHLARLGPLGMPNEAWTRALGDLLLLMTSSTPGHRPTAQQVVDVLRQYAEQAEGDGLAALASGVVRAAPDMRRSSRSEGDLSGTRFRLPVGGSEAPRARRAEGPPPTPQDPALDDEPAPTVQGTPWVAHPTIAPLDDTYASIRAPGSGLSRPLPLGPILAPGASSGTSSAAGSAPPPPLRATPAPRPPAVLPSQPTAPAPPPVAYAPPPRPAAPAAPVARRQRSPWTWIALAVLALFALGILVVAGAGFAWVLLSREAPAPSATPLTVRPGDPSIQWIEVQADGAAPTRTRGAFKGDVPAGRYDLAVKVVGRGAVRGSLDVGSAPVDLTCKPGKEGRVLCSGGGGHPTVELAP
ncbi:MAG: protein kinase [Deltaproteobacteria bacterium]|nr:protein kinase [Deltaproteobacteria bacterium]